MILGRMRRLWLLGLVALAPLAAEPPPTEVDATAARIVDLHLQARGGEARLRAVRSLRLTGHLSEGKSHYETEWHWREGDDFRIETWHEQLGRIHREARAVSAGEGWRQVLSPRSERPKVLESAPARALHWEATSGCLLFRHLLDWRKKGHLLSYDGALAFHGRKTYRVKAQLRDGPLVYYYFDQETFFLRALGFSDHFAGSSVDAEMFPTGARRVEGIVIETGWEWRVNGQTYRHLSFDQIMANAELDDELFRLPPQSEVWLRQAR